jgi:Flp pilus assembly protein TadG
MAKLGQGELFGEVSRRSVRDAFARTEGRTKAPRFCVDTKALMMEEGSQLVEFAIICILLLMLLFGIAGFGQALYSYHFVSHAAREATRYAAVRGETCGSDGSCAASNSASGTAGPTSQTDIQQFVTNMAPLGINASSTGCGGSGCLIATLSYPVQSDGPAICNTAVGTPSVGPYDNYPGCTVQVQVNYTFHFVFPLITSNSLTVSSYSEMVIAH